MMISYSFLNGLTIHIDIIYDRRIIIDYVLMELGYSVGILLYRFGRNESIHSQFIYLFLLNHVLYAQETGINTTFFFLFGTYLNYCEIIVMITDYKTPSLIDYEKMFVFF